MDEGRLKKELRKNILMGQKKERNLLESVFERVSR